ncbi:MAG: alpha/beta hydrolase [Oligoflexia bacterium]|nr:alpha/beta hydrolase [Oligoflexia bacterium]
MNKVKKLFDHYLILKDQTKIQTKIHFSTNFCPHHFETSLKKFKLNAEAPLLIFNYGLVCSNHHWSKQLPFFHKHGYPILIHDYRGHYSSSLINDPASSCDFAHFAKDIKALINFIKVKKCIMLGHSMGVNVCLEFAKLYPKNTNGIVLISGTIFPPSETMFDSKIMETVFPIAYHLSHAYPNLVKKIWDFNAKSTLVQKIILHEGFNEKRVPISFVKKYLAKINELGPDIFFRLFAEMNKHKIAHSLKKIHTPSLVIGGDNDKVIPNHVQRVLHNKLSNSELYIVKDGSHVPQVDFPEMINERILLFIQKLERSKVGVV